MTHLNNRPFFDQLRLARHQEKIMGTDKAINQKLLPYESPVVQAKPSRMARALSGITFGSAMGGVFTAVVLLMVSAIRSCEDSTRDAGVASARASQTKADSAVGRTVRSILLDKNRTGVTIVLDNGETLRIISLVRGSVVSVE